MNYKVTLCFDGSKYSGWQFQNNAPTVQGTLTECAKKFFSRPVTVTGCSRTDSKVHAENFVCNIKTDVDISPVGIVKGMNNILPPEIAVRNCEVADENFHARYDCKLKEYRYIIFNAENRNPFFDKRACHFSALLDEKKMDSEIKKLIGTHDFRSFMASGSKITDTVRTVYSAGVIREGDLVTVSISANGFLYNMVRIIVGTVIDISLGRNKLDISEILEKKERKYAGFTASPEGLYLYRAEY